MLTIGIYFLSDSDIFHPTKYKYANQKNIFKIKTDDGVDISAMYLPNPKADYTILLSHGNADNLKTIEWYLKALHAKGFAVFAYDYQGYGASEGKPSEKNTYRDAIAAYDYLTKQLHIPANHIIDYGNSLGAAVAVDVATRRSFAGLIVESPFLSAYRVITQIPVLLFDKFNNLRKIKNVRCPILVIHGTADKVVPFWQGKKLYEEANLPKTFLEIQGADHTNVTAVGKETYWAAIRNFSKELNK